MSACAQRSNVSRHFGGGLSQAAEHALREHLEECRDCRGLYRRHLLFAGLDPYAPPAAERLGRGLGVRWRWKLTLPVTAVAAVAAAAAALLFVLPGTTWRYVGRGSGAPPPPRVLVYRTTDERAPSLVGKEIRSDDELAFAYENQGRARWLLIFGVDEHRHIYWYHPSWADPAANPTAVAVGETHGIRELPEGVRHKLDGQSLAIVALFVDEPVSVHAIEALVARQATVGAPLPLPHAQQHVLNLRVLPRANP